MYKAPTLTCKSTFLQCVNLRNNRTKVNVLPANCTLIGAHTACNHSLNRELASSLSCVVERGESCCCEPFHPSVRAIVDNCWRNYVYHRNISLKISPLSKLIPLPIYTTPAPLNTTTTTTTATTPWSRRAGRSAARPLPQPHHRQQQQQHPPNCRERNKQRSRN